MKKMLSVLLVLCMVFALAACGGKEPAATTQAPTTQPATQATEAPTTEPAPTEAPTGSAESEGTVMTHKEYVAAELDTPVCVETYVQACQGWWDNKITVYAQSEDGAYFLYNMECAEETAAKLVPGTKIRVSGYKGEWSGEVEIMDATFEILEGSYIAEAVDVTDLLAKDELIDHQNEKITLTGLTVAPSKVEGSDEEFAFLYNWDGSGAAGNNNDLYFNVTDGTNTYTLTVESYLCGETTDVYRTVTTLKVGDAIDIEGFLYWYKGAQPHVTSVTVK